MLVIIMHETLMPDWAPMSMKIDWNERDFHIKSFSISHSVWDFAHGLGDILQQI